MTAQLSREERRRLFDACLNLPPAQWRDAMLSHDLRILDVSLAAFGFEMGPGFIGKIRRMLRSLPCNDPACDARCTEAKP